MTSIMKKAMNSKNYAIFQLLKNVDKNVLKSPNANITSGGDPQDENNVCSNLQVYGFLNMKKEPFQVEFQLFVYKIFWDFICLFTLRRRILAICLHRSNVFQLFVYIKVTHFSCLFTLRPRISAVCIHQGYIFQLFYLQ